MNDPIARQNEINANALPTEIADHFGLVESCFETTQNDLNECREFLANTDRTVNDLRQQLRLKNEECDHISASLNMARQISSIWFRLWATTCICCLILFISVVVLVIG
jgi:hypothetical protein